jgi:hypothetical protein
MVLVLEIDLEAKDSLAIWVEGKVRCRIARVTCCVPAVRDDQGSQMASCSSARPD